jgi:hypothetical protein
MGCRMACPGGGVKGNKKATVIRPFFSSHIDGLYGILTFRFCKREGSICRILPGSEEAIFLGAMRVQALMAIRPRSFDRGIVAFSREVH